MQSFQGTNPGNIPIHKTPISRRKFSNEEDEKLKSLVLTYGTNDWRNIASQMNNRNARQCRERWKHYLSPSVSNGPWSEAEDELLREKYKELGSQWSRIAKFFPKRTDITVKNRWISLNGRSKKGANKQNQEEKTKVMIPPPVDVTEMNQIQSQGRVQVQAQEQYNPVETQETTA
ncbi:Myb-like DNA-binding domain containing protein [Histomonas meleagridis]|uniref:Myb-like DNA-binding domain containing protein n=1 Tax=Histomonas meleagridis TaxID=135588 RepID=UPI00355A5F05|nr:Myb-like DNA-binding domain containing protein [Histomonas meleagridis]KAH0796086.1 Myb-like DNA-binding domain containing protein [Histomonas meleagridis]